MSGFTDFASKRGTSSRQRTRNKNGAGSGLTCTVKVQTPTAEEHNARALLRHGPGRTAGFRKWIAGRDPKVKLVLVGGSGPLGCAFQWEREGQDHGWYESFDEAPEIDTGGKSLAQLNNPLGELMKENARREAVMFERYTQAKVACE